MGWGIEPENRAARLEEVHPGTQRGKETRWCVAPGNPVMLNSLSFTAVPFSA